MAFFNLDCLGGQAEAIIFHDAFDKYKEIIKDNNIVFLVGHTSTQNDFADLKLIVDEVIPINHANKVLKLNEVNIRLPKNSSKDLMNKEKSGSSSRIFKILSKSFSNSWVELVSNDKLKRAFAYLNEASFVNEVFSLKSILHAKIKIC